MKNTSPTPKATRPRSAASHQAIIAAAVRILSEQGPAAFTIERVAKVSGTGKPTIYRWWPSKTALLIEVFDHETAAYVAIPDLHSTYDELLTWFNGVWDMWQTSVGGAAFRVILAEIQSDQQALQFFNDAFVVHRRARLLAVLQRAQQRGELQGRDLEVIVDYCWGFNWYHLLTHTTPSQAAIREVIATVTRS
ncbi:MAG TPA: TetR/AcrR family transcriptional regulator [Candidatus Saccharimonadales bacterium]|nr:TetR/AcrR family transcriptional regulator [Candidatus Saccharimonadales bacterium]